VIEQNLYSTEVGIVGVGDLLNTWVDVHKFLQACHGMIHLRECHKWRMVSLGC